MIYRFIENHILKDLHPGTVVELFGARQAGKTVLMNEIRKKIPKGKKVLMVHGETLKVKSALSSQDIDILREFSSGYDYLFIDEAQKIPDIGLNLKLMTDLIPDLSIFVTGSSSFDLRNKTGEPLVGRSLEYHLFPIAQIELKNREDYLQSTAHLDSRLIYGSYPQIMMQKTVADKVRRLNKIRDGFLLKDILELDNVKNSLFVFNLLRLIAFQIGNDISYTEIAQNLNSHPVTVMRYLDLLQKTFILFSLYGFSRNLRSEYTKTPRYYFWDNGIRNAVISNFNPLNMRDDTGKLWENYIIAERLKKVHYLNLFCNRFFWRTYDLQEIDYLEESEGKLSGYEIKWGRAKYRKPKVFLSSYPHSSLTVINRQNYLEFIA